MQPFRRGISCTPVYWGGDPNLRMRAEQTPEKIRRGLEDQLRMNGRPVWLWTPVTGAAAGTVPCTCDKDTTQNSDFKCLSCFGARYAPGFWKFLHETVYFASAEYAGYPGPYPAAQGAFTLTGVTVDRNKKPNRLTLAAGAATGTIVTVAKPYVNAGDDDWEIELAAFKKTAGDTVALEYSTGGSYHSITLTGGPLFGYRGTITGVNKPTGTGTIRFRITLTRSSALTPEGPSFEILRARHVRSLDVNPELQLRPDYEDGQILILKTWDQEFVAREAARGRTVEGLGDRSMTAPLDYFDTSITTDTPAAALDDREAGPHPFFEHSSGVRTNQRYAIHAVNLDTTIVDVMSHQSFSERRTQAGELYALVW